MDTSGRQPWVRAATLLTALYFVAGIALSIASVRVASIRAQPLRLSFIFPCAVAWLIHIWYECVRLRSRPVIAAAHTAAAVAVASFALAVVAVVRSFWVAAANRLFFSTSLVIWPAFAGVLAFLGALLLAFAFSLVAGSRDAPNSNRLRS